MNICDITSALDLEMRQAHHDTMEDLRCIQKVGDSGFGSWFKGCLLIVMLQDMKDYVHDTIHRLDEYCANIGVTDRFSGYRNSMNWGIRDPIRCLPKIDPEERDQCDCENLGESNAFMFFLLCYCYFSVALTLIVYYYYLIQSL